MQLDDKVYRLGMVQSRISNAKNSLITYTAYEQNKELVESDMNAKVPLLREIYKRYQNRCLQAGAMEWNVPIHNRRAVCSPVMAAIRSFISRAALLVKVSAKIL